MSFSKLKGQDHAVQILRSSLRSGRTPHAYLFIGPDGVGRKLAAMTLAKAVNCEESKYDSCDRCPSCMKIDHESHGDLKIIEPEETGVIRVDAIRKLQKSLSFRHVEARVKVGIVMGAESMNPSSSNAILKTLEEPTTNTLIILLAPGAGTVLSTIVSRCQVLRFRPLPLEVVEEKLKKKYDLDEPSVKLISAMSNGSLGKAFELATDEKFVSETRPATIKDLMRLVALRREGLHFRFAQEIAGSEDSRRILESLKLWYRDLLLTKLGVGAEKMLNRDLADVAGQCSALLTTEEIMRGIDRMEEAEKSLDARSNPQLTIEVLVNDLAGNRGRANF
ncbi:DNA polymerase III subunit delta' [Thermodesulfobacteriota bacterium]